MRPQSLVLALAALLPGAPVRADEGMWTFDNLPVARMKASYGFAPDAAWLHRLQVSTLRMSGGTASFVSRDGLVLTNHHMGRAFIQQLSTAGRDFIRAGFAAGSREQELRIPGAELQMLVATEDVTAQVEKATAGLAEADALVARRNAISAMIKAKEASGLTWQPVTLYHGGQHWLYGYRKFTDVRLVAAPEMQLAFFGGDADNFTYPRQNLDFAMFRVYENDKPYHPEAWLSPAAPPLRNGDLTFVAGHPGATYRQETAAKMAYARDTGIPARVASLKRRKAVLEAYAASGDEPRRLAATTIYGFDNGIKRLEGMLSGLVKPGNLEGVARAEAELRARVAQDPALKAAALDSWNRIVAALARQKELLGDAPLAGDREILGSDLLARALLLVRMPVEMDKPATKRLAEFGEGSLKATRERLLNPAPVSLELETVKLTAGLTDAVAVMGADHPSLKAVLAGRTPEAAARAAMAATKLGDAAVRKALMEGGTAALAACQDPLVVLARTLEPLNRAVRERSQAEVQSVLDEHGGRIATARFKVYGTSMYPDATSTLRLTYGPVATYPANGTLIQPFTTFYGLYDRAASWGPEASAGAWALPQRWWDRKDRLDLATPFNFAYACDTVGGNSGSPVVNAKGELVGLNFDSNIEAQAGYYIYDGTTKRSIAVDVRAIREALVKIMDAAWVAAELDGR